MSQNNLPASPIDPSAESGTALAGHLGNWRDALHTQHSGSSRPSYVQPGMLWLDTTTAASWVWKFYTGSVDIPVFQFDSTAGKLKSRAAESSIASAATTDVLGAATDFVAVSGTTTITSLGSTPLQIKYVRFTGVLTLTHNATSLILPNNGNNITTAVGDTMIVVSDSAGNARVMNYTLAAGAPASTIPSGTLMLFQQTSAPAGWTKQVTHDDKALRVVSGTAGSGGTVAFTTCFSRTATDSHAVTQAELPAVNFTVTDPGHTHTQSTGNTASVGSNVAPTGGSGKQYAGSSPSPVDSATTGISVASGGSGTGHTHPMDIRVQYVDVIICSKN